MSQSPPSSKQMLDSLNKIDPVAFYTSSDVPSPLKMSTISPVNIGEASPLNPQSPFDLNNPSPSQQPGPYLVFLSNHMFEGDLPHSKSFESNILAASESIAIESLAKMTQEVIHDEGSNFANDEGGEFAEWILRDTEPVFDQTPEVGVYPSYDSSDIDEDKVPLKWSVPRRMVPVTTNGIEKVTIETPKKGPLLEQSPKNSWEML
ncbi:hypothetical protein KY284_023310 [Solanum tuberosum]|nr:hypothetical protein KY284_023310 [Solanum tuberosum]